MQQSDRTQLLNHLTLALFTAFFAVALSLLFWSVFRASALGEREDNPRPVLDEIEIERGRVLDRNGRFLAVTDLEAERELLVPQPRRYPLAEATGPAVGYYSFRHGTAGIEESLDSLLRGDEASFWGNFWRQTLHRPQAGQDVELTIDAGLQETAVSILTAQGEKGALLLLGGNDLGKPEAIAMVSLPSYDPNLLDEQFDHLVEDEAAPLLNRVTQGLYPPGRLLLPLLIGSATEAGLIGLDEVVLAELAEGDCINPPEQPLTWEGVLLSRCGSPVAQIGDQLGRSGLDQLFATAGLTVTPTLAINTEVAPVLAVEDPLLAAQGQEGLSVTPLQIAQLWWALGEGGALPTVQLLADASPTAPNQENGRFTAIVPDELLTAFVVPVLSGPGGVTNGWYASYFVVEERPFVLVIVLEDVLDLAGMISVGEEMKTAVRQLDLSTE